MTPKKLCLTPVKNEGWIIKNFVKAASCWADRILIANQNSTDNFQKIICNFQKVKLIDNKSTEFNEPERQKNLINFARNQNKKKILFALDADEFLIGFNTKEWQKIQDLPLGTVIYFPWCNIHPDLKHYWLAPELMPLAFVDDGITKHQGKKIHSVRIPYSENSPKYYCQEIKILHFQYVDWQRMWSKQRWYMCWELINNHKSWWQIYLEYHHMYAIPKKSLKLIPKSWFSEYKKLGVDLTRFRKESDFWWDDEVLEFFKKYGVEKFRMLDIWDRKWGDYQNPQGFFIIIFFKTLKNIYPSIYNLYIFLPKIKKTILRRK